MKALHTIPGTIPSNTIETHKAVESEEQTMNLVLPKEKHITLTLYTVIATFAITSAVRYLPKKKTKTENLHDIDHIITTRRTISAFQPELPIGWEDIIRKSIQSAIRAPNHKRTEPWRFYVPSNDTIKKICELNASIVAEGKGGAKAGEAKLKKWLKVPGWIVVTCVKEKDRDENMSDPKGRDREDYAAVCCAIQNLTLSLHAKGIGTKWGTGKVNFDERFHRLVGIPDSEYVVGTIWFGKSAKAPASRETKMSVNDVLKIAY